MAGLVGASTQLPFIKDPLDEVRADAQAAIKALDAGDLVALEAQLAANRGQADFAYYFTSETTPRALGDALSTAAGESDDTPLREDVDAHAYALTLADLAGTLGLATFGTGDRALAAAWTDDFITATTTPEELYGDESDGADVSEQVRSNQDVANKQNLLLLLSRGYWSTEFLQAVTDAYWLYDLDQGDDAWSGTSLEDAKYAPAPSGQYLTDGILALTAALTANAEASAWAFTDFQPGTEEIDGSNYAIGRFTHYLMFEHRFPGSSDGEGAGRTATLTALSSAIEATDGAADADDTSTSASRASAGPVHDVLVLQNLAKDLSEENGCSWNPLDYWHCAVAVAESVWRWIQDWGHLTLDILAGATFAPPPFTAVGVAAAVTNATWYAIDGDYVAAGLSLAAAVPGLAFTKIATGVKAGVTAEKAAAEADDIAEVATTIRAAVGPENTMAKVVTADSLRVRPNVWATTKSQVRAEAKKTAEGDFIDPNTGKVIPSYGKFDYGHKPGYEWRCTKMKALSLGWTQQELNNYFNDPSHYQIEDRASNRSHLYESDTCAA
ncbi:GH-E family nuclease [Mumia flava]|uniref:GH-E family nuclease n=1 Tax=Mumia flava TaxID=1348852 RepID=UPI000C234241|nr:GH-E family nuclease [Mumia flava]